MSGREQGLRFLLVGAFNTAFGFVVFALLLHFADNQVHYLVVLVVATIIAVLAAFTVYRRFVFRVRGRVLKDLGRFSLVYIAALAVNLVVLPLLVEGFGVPILPAQAVVVVGTVIASFLAHRSFSFRR
ncbi:MAG: GtrA family protein [Actinomycetota bacterium]|nr:GtrA family protein [Actinomycetota bacterium]